MNYINILLYKMLTSHAIILGILILVVAIFILSFTCSKTDNFSCSLNNNTSDMKVEHFDNDNGSITFQPHDENIFTQNTFPIEFNKSNSYSITKYFISDIQDTLFSGFVIKKYNNDQYEYIFQLNLPLSYGGDYIDTAFTYDVYVGNDELTTHKIGTLQRQNDGWYVYYMHNPNNYKFAQIVSKNTVLLKTDM
jgi:hypothetical protein